MSPSRFGRTPCGSSAGRALLRRIVLGALVVVACLRAVPGDVEERTVVLKTADKKGLAATYWPGAVEGCPGVVLLPGFDGTRGDWRPCVRPLLARGFGVLALDPRGFGDSAKQGRTDVGALVKRRDSKTFQAMQQDAIAGVRWLAKDGACDPKRIVLGGADVTAAVVVDAAGRYPKEIAALIALTPETKAPGLDVLALLKDVPTTMPLLLMGHVSDLDAGAMAIVLAHAGTLIDGYAELPPPEAAKDKAWARGTRMFGKLALAELTVASFAAQSTGSTKEPVVLDGLILAKGAEREAWSIADDVGSPRDGCWIRAFRVGRRILFGGEAPPDVHGIRLEVETGHTSDAPVLGPPQIVGVDLGNTARMWTWGGMGSLPPLPGLDTSGIFGKTFPALRALPRTDGTTFEGEWYVPPLGKESDEIEFLVSFDTDPVPKPDGPMVEALPGTPVKLVSR